MQNKFHYLFRFVLVALFLTSCEKLEAMPDSPLVTDSSDVDEMEPATPISSSPASPAAERIVRMRARQMTQIKWTPLERLRYNNGYYQPNKTIKGIPYSSVKECDKFVGIEVSFKTFMTAVHNRRSVLYTEQIDQPPYHGKNGVLYYGTVCSAAVDYALGLKAPYGTSLIKKCGLFALVSPQDISAARVGDILWTSGHELMIYDIVRDADDSTKVTRVSVFESAVQPAAIISYDLAAFMKRWERAKWVLYRYERLAETIQYTPVPFVNIEDEVWPAYPYNDIICPSRGDEAAYRAGEDVVINVLDPDYTRISLFLDDEVIDEGGPEENDRVYRNLAPGRYSVTAANVAGDISDKISFDVVDCSVTAELHGDKIDVSFHSGNGSPEYVVLCNDYGDRYDIVEFTEQEIEAGRAVINFPRNKPECYCKVFFSTSYGKVSNEPILIKK